VISIMVSCDLTDDSTTVIIDGSTPSPCDKFSNLLNTDCYESCYPIVCPGEDHFCVKNKETEKLLCLHKCTLPNDCPPIKGKCTPIFLEGELPHYVCWKPRT